MGLDQNSVISFDDAIGSWYENVYLPLVQAILEQGLTEDLPNYTLTDLYLIISDYQWLLRESDIEDDEHSKLANKLAEFHNEKEVRQLQNYLRRTNWISQMIIDNERADFLARTQLDLIRPATNIQLSLPGKYDNLLEHNNAHHYFLGMDRQANVPYEEAVASFVDTIYDPLLELIGDQGTLDDFQPRRTEADLVLWVLDHRQDLVQALKTLPGPGES
jgi:hypothetical protein